MNLPNLDIAIMLVMLIIGMYVPDMIESIRSARFWSPERKRLKNIARGLR